jgi:hypothetical protein
VAVAPTELVGAPIQTPRAVCLDVLQVHLGHLVQLESEVLMEQLDQQVYLPRFSPQVWPEVLGPLVQTVPAVAVAVAAVEKAAPL